VFRTGIEPVLHGGSGSAHRPVLANPHLGVWRTPDFSAVVYRRHPDQIMLLAVIDHRNGISIALFKHMNRYRRIELDEHEKLS
jgi:hypothetical protein